MKIIGSSTFITNFKVDDILIRLYPATRKMNGLKPCIDNSWTTERNGGPIKITEITKDKIIFLQYYGQIVSESNKHNYIRTEHLKIGWWLDGWKKVNI